MERIFIVLAALSFFSICAGCDSSAARPSQTRGIVTTFQLSERNVEVSGPLGFALLRDEAPDIRKQFDDTKPQQNLLHAVFLDQIDLAHLLEG